MKPSLPNGMPPIKAKAYAAPSELPPNYWRYTLQAAVLCLALIAATSALLLWDTTPNIPDLYVGTAAPSDVLAPSRITYQSDIATLAARDRAANAVQDIYTTPSPEIIDQQIEYARAIFDRFSTVRSDPSLTLDERVAKINELPDLSVAPSVIRSALGFSDEMWDSTVDITLRVMEEIMTEGIKENQLVEVRPRLSALLSSDVLPAEQEKVVMGLARALVVPTSFYDVQATETARQQARDEIKYVERTIERGQAIVRAGDIITELDLEELDAVGLVQQEQTWQRVLGTVLLVATIIMIPMVFIQHLRVGFWSHWKRLLLICTMTIATITLAKFMVPDHVLLPYLFPMASISMLLTLLLEDPSLAIILTVMLGLLISLMADAPLDMAVLTIVTGSVAALTILRREKLSAFVRAGLVVTVVHIVISIAFRLYHRDYDLAALSQLAVAGLLNGVLSASVTFATFSWMGRLFGITTALQLLELARPTQPLLKQMALKAPGTYHHTIIVSNMAEQAAEAIGANGLLARIGGYYHDIGKTVRPYFFIENASEEDNIHSRLDPKTSAQIIISHATDGLELAKKHRLPQQICDIIIQHHGTTKVGFFYQQALQQAESGETVDEAEFRYPGPQPHSKEAAIVMLADVEAAVRSQRPATMEDTDHLIRQYINARLTDGQLDECELTLRDLDQIRASFVSVLKGVFHPRIKYPSSERTNTSEPTTATEITPVQDAPVTMASADSPVPAAQHPDMAISDDPSPQTVQSTTQTEAETP